MEIENNRNAPLKDFIVAKIDHKISNNLGDDPQLIKKEYSFLFADPNITVKARIAVPASLKAKDFTYEDMGRDGLFIKSIDFLVRVYISGDIIKQTLGLPRIDFTYQKEFKTIVTKEADGNKLAIVRWEDPDLFKFHYQWIDKDGKWTGTLKELRVKNITLNLPHKPALYSFLSSEAVALELTEESRSDLIASSIDPRSLSYAGINQLNRTQLNYFSKTLLHPSYNRKILKAIKHELSSLKIKPPGKKNNGYIRLASGIITFDGVTKTRMFIIRTTDLSKEFFKIENSMLAAYKVFLKIADEQIKSAVRTAIRLKLKFLFTSHFPDFKVPKEPSRQPMTPEKYTKVIEGSGGFTAKNSRRGDRPQPLTETDEQMLDEAWKQAGE